jgi:DNA-binding NarL/FixJ family response regulator
MDNGEPALVLIDATVHNGLAAANLLHRQGSTTRLVVFGMDDAVKDIALWTDAGIVAYPGRSLGLREIVELIGMVISNEAAVSASTAPLAHKAKSQSNSLSTATRGAQATLTAREDQVVRLVISGASNKEIARLLDISVATVKSHVHNLLGKLGLTGRGKLAVRYRGGHSSPDVMRAME